MTTEGRGRLKAGTLRIIENSPLLSSRIEGAGSDTFAAPNVR
jgi:hypothetical protein